MIEVHASTAHYWRHLAPIVAELRARGHDVQAWSTRGAGDPWAPPRPAHRPRGDLALVASSVDARLTVGQPTVYLEHGAGQTYDGDPHSVGLPGWPGGRGLDHVALFLCPGEHVAGRWRAVYPHARVEVVGCPALDARLPVSGTARRAEKPEVVAWTWHWNCGAAPEARPALDHYLPHLPSIVAELHAAGYHVLGHGHPRLWRRAEHTWRRIGVPTEPEWERVLDQAAVLIGDNTSALYEFAATGRPVVCLNAPWYRRDIDHGLRFWSHVPGVQVDDPAGVAAGVALALADPAELSALRTRATEHVYAHRDGTATRRAADAIEEAYTMTSKAGYPTRREVRSEVQGPLDMVLGRLQVLGATDDEIDALTAAWQAGQLDRPERDRLLHMNDVELRAEIAATRAEWQYHTTTEDEAAELQAEQERRERVAALAVEAYEENAGNVDDVLAWVGDDADRAAAMREQEKLNDRPRVTVLRGTADVLEAHGIAVDDDTQGEPE